MHYFIVGAPNFTYNPQNKTKNKTIIPMVFSPDLPLVQVNHQYERDCTQVTQGNFDKYLIKPLILYFSLPKTYVLQQEHYSYLYIFRNTW
jgi:hypothetical protein